MAKKLGKLTVEIDADSDRLETSTKKAKSELKDVGDAGKKSGKQVGAGFQNVGTKIQKSTEGVRTFTSSLTETVGIVTGIAGVAASLGAVFVSLVNKSKEFNKTLENTSKLSKERLQDTRFAVQNENEIAAIRREVQRQEDEQVKKIQEELPQTARSILGAAAQGITELVSRTDLLGEFDTDFEKVAKAAREIKRIENRTDNIEFLKVQAAKERSEQDLAKRARQIRISLIDDEIEKIKERTKLEIEEETEAAKKRGVLDTKRFRELINQIKARRDAEIKAAKDTAEAKEKIEDQKRRDRLRKDQEAAKAAAEAFRQELSGVADSLFGGAGSNITTRLDTLINEVRSATSAIGRRP